MPLDGLRHAAVPCHSLASHDPAVMMQFVICTASTCIADIVVTPHLPAGRRCRALLTLRFEFELNLQLLAGPVCCWLCRQEIWDLCKKVRAAVSWGTDEHNAHPPPCPCISFPSKGSFSSAPASNVAPCSCSLVSWHIASHGRYGQAESLHSA